MKINTPKYILDIKNKITSNGYECYLVGGCVRDTLLNKVPKDYDLATNCDISTLKEIFKEYVFINNNGEKHNTLTIYYQKNNIEITTFKYDGNENKSIEVDLSHRDITINAIAYDDKIIDPYNGCKDLKNKIIKAVNSPYDRFKEDPLRILRVLRFASTLGFKIDKMTSQAMIALKDLLLNISVERIKNELDGILVGENVKEILMSYHEIIFTIIPELKITYNFNQRNKYHNHSLYEHIVNVCANTKANSILKMAALLHDIAKPYCISIDENNQAHYYNHTTKGKEMSEVILKRLKYSNDEITRICYLIIKHDITLVINKKSIRKNFANTPNLDVELFYLLIDLINADKKDHTTYTLIDINEVKLIMNQINENNECLKITDLDIDGNDLLALGYKGKEIGKTLSYLLKAVFEEKVNNNKTDLIEYLNKK